MTTVSAASRLTRARDALLERGADLLLVAPSADMRYLIGRERHASERPTLLTIPTHGDPFVLVAAFEAPGVEGIEGLSIVPYGEVEDPYLALRDALASQPGPRRALLNDQAWAIVLLRLQETFPDTRFGSASQLLGSMRMQKQPEEIDLLRRAGAMADAAFGELVSREFAGRSEREVGEELTALLKQQGLETAGWGPIVGSGPNSTSPHHTAGDRIIREGDAVVLDFGGTLDGYSADITRTVHVGETNAEFRRVYGIVQQAQQTAVDAVRPGVQAQAVDRAARGVIEAAGYGDFFIHRTGHGIGLDEHEEPYIIAGNDLPLGTGMTFSVEPGVYLPGRFGVRIEDIVAVTEGGAERLNNAPRDLVVVR